MIDTFSLLQKYTGISKYSQSEVITPQNIVKDMVDLLPQEVFNPDVTFFDPAVKSGRFLIEIYNRLMASPLLDHIPEPDRHNHIIEKQLFGFATSPTAATVVRKALYNDPLVTGNIRFTDGKVTKESVLGAFNNMKFDVVIGNPPYNKGMDLDFVNLGFEISTKYCVMITPAKWQTADANQGVMSEMTYGEFRKKLVPHMSHVVFYPDCKDVFDIGQIDGTTYYLLDKSIHRECNVTNRCNIQKYFNSVDTRCICNGESLHNIGNEILVYVKRQPKYKRFTFPHVADERYEVWTNTQMASGSRGGMTSCLLTTEGNSQFIGVSTFRDNTKTVPPTSSTAKIVFSSKEESEARSFLSWIDTKFVRFFLAINISKLSNIMCNNFFRFVPAPPSGKFDHIYTDDELYKDFNLPQKYIDVIEAVVKERK